jgi:hypothetical protein
MRVVLGCCCTHNINAILHSIPRNFGCKPFRSPRTNDSVPYNSQWKQRCTGIGILIPTIIMLFSTLKWTLTYHHVVLYFKNG